jgi:hypothetical protein
MPEVSAAKKDNVLLSWKSGMHIYSVAGLTVSPTVMVLAMLIGMVLLFAQEWMLLVLMASMIFLGYAWKKSVPNEFEVVLTTQGVRVFGKLYLWTDFSSWRWTTRQGKRIIALVNVDPKVMTLYLPTEGVEEKRVDEIFRERLDYVEPTQGLVDKTEKWFKDKFPLDNGK